MRYRLARLRDRVPMPERGAGVFFTSEKTGEVVNELDPYYARMIADGDLVPVEEGEEQPETPTAPSGKSKER